MITPITLEDHYNHYRHHFLECFGSVNDIVLRLCYVVIVRLLTIITPLP